MVDIAFGALGLKLFERIITNLANDEVLRSKFEENGKSIMDFLQVNLGKVSKRSESEEIFLAINSSDRQDKETLCEIVAVITTLFTTCKIERGAQVGGTLLAEFGDKVYPHIAERELRYKLPVNAGIKRKAYNMAMNDFDNIMKENDISDISELREKMKGMNLSSGSLGATSSAIAIAGMSLGFGFFSSLLGNVLSLFKTK
ncbi:hypothetical protein [Providencia sp. PROV273]|uniref:hypothetical protein n=1 Tax=Providencia sp. PROV273 TaxID=2949960 RepID=UPI002348EFBF|nr:hypothetical protein [Providencia sp. PROV273]